MLVSDKRKIPISIFVDNYMVTELKYFSDALRCDMILNFIEACKKYSNYNEGTPEYDMLMDVYEGYENQTYIQSIPNKQFILYEGWSSLCWDALYSKDEYKGLTHIECLNKFFVERIPVIAKECNIKVIECKYEFHESWGDNIEDGYIMLITFQLV